MKNGEERVKNTVGRGGSVYLASNRDSAGLGFPCLELLTASKSWAALDGKEWPTGMRRPGPPPRPGSPATAQLRGAGCRALAAAAPASSRSARWALGFNEDYLMLQVCGAA